MCGRISGRCRWAVAGALRRPRERATGTRLGPRLLRSSRDVGSAQWLWSIGVRLYAVARFAHVRSMPRVLREAAGWPQNLRGLSTHITPR